MKNSTKSLLIYIGGTLFLLVTDILLIAYGGGLSAIIIGILAGLQAFIAAELFKWSYRLEQRKEHKRYIIGHIQYSPEQIEQLKQIVNNLYALTKKLSEGDSNEGQE